MDKLKRNILRLGVPLVVSVPSFFQVAAYSGNWRMGLVAGLGLFMLAFISMALLEIAACVGTLLDASTAQLTSNTNLIQSNRMALESNTNVIQSCTNGIKSNAMVIQSNAMQARAGSTKT